MLKLKFKIAKKNKKSYLLKYFLQILGNEAFAKILSLPHEKYFLIKSCSQTECKQSRPSHVALVLCGLNLWRNGISAR